MSYLENKEYLGTNALAKDAWGRQKTVSDRSLLHAVWTYDISPATWKELLDGVETAGVITNCVSFEGALTVTSTTGVTTTLRSLRHPRYQPNRGHLFSSAGWLPAQTESGSIREWGLDGGDCAIKFRWDETADTLYAVRRRLGVDEEVTALTLPAGFDITMGHLYDIQFQWRGVGDYFFFIDNALIHSTSNLGNLEEGDLPTICNPALPVCFSSDGVSPLRFSCIDVTSEGGTRSNLTYRSVTTPVDITSISTNSTNANGDAVLAIRINSTFQSKYNTRDFILNRITTFCKDECTTGVFTTRDASIIGAIAENSNPTLGWADVNWVDSPMQYMLGGSGSLLETTFESNNTGSNTQHLVSKRVEIDHPNVMDNPNGKSEFYLTNGDYLIVTMRPDGAGKNSGCTIELSEEL